MKFRPILCTLLTSLLAVSASGDELFSFSAPDGTSGLRLAWRADSSAPWQPVGEGFDFVKSDFGPWGSHKKMFSPKLFVNAADSNWTCVRSATPSGDVTALAVSPDLISWKPQSYYGNPADLPRDMRPLNRITPDSALIGGRWMKGYRQEVKPELIAALKSYVSERGQRYALLSQHAADDSARFAGLKTVSFSATAQPDKAYPISDKLIGIFFEDINYGADGGLYAELVQNRDFEYKPSDCSGDPAWNSTRSWTTSGGGSMTIDTVSPIHPNNLHYAKIAGPLTLTNSGYDGIPVRKGEKYKLSIALRSSDRRPVSVSLTDPAGKAIASATIRPEASDDWKKYTAVLKAGRTEADASLSLTFAEGTDADVDMISLFPEATFKGRDNGLRRDLAQTLADLKPRFVRFPGGCVAHGDGLDNSYEWKGSVGPLEARRPLRNLWGYHQTRGLGYHEYFLFCEDIGAEPLPVLAAGVPCQNSGNRSRHSHDAITTFGQQCGVPMEEMDSYIQDILDLIEYANGDVTTVWGAKRAEAGHPAPFNLKYLGIGNEDLISDVFIPRFRMIFDAVREKHPEITVIGTVGPFYEGSDYDAGWQLARELGIPMVDEHYYVDPAWMIHNQNFYDSYPRDATKVYLGEYAAHLPRRPNNIETALAEALYLTSVERNADVVEMTSYAPLLAKDGHTQWRPDLIYFNNTEVRPTTDYHVQHMFGNNSGTRYIPAPLTVGSDNADVVNRIGLSTVYDETTGDYIVKLVNLLPVTATGNLDLSPLGVKATKVRAIRLSGSPADSGATPRETDLTLPAVSLPPYSFTLFRIHP